MYAIYQQMFASLVPAIAIGAACERGRVLPVIPFTFAWGTIVYNVIAYDVVSRLSVQRQPRIKVRRSGTRTDGLSSSVSSTTQVAAQSKSLPE